MGKNGSDLISSQSFCSNQPSLCACVAMVELTNEVPIPVLKRLFPLILSFSVCFHSVSYSKTPPNPAASSPTHTDNTAFFTSTVLYGSWAGP